MTKPYSYCCINDSRLSNSVTNFWRVDTYGAFAPGWHMLRHEMDKCCICQFCLWGKEMNLLILGTSIAIHRTIPWWLLTSSTTQSLHLSVKISLGHLCKLWTWEAYWDVDLNWRCAIRFLGNLCTSIYSRSLPTLYNHNAFRNWGMRCWTQGLCREKLPQ